MRLGRSSESLLIKRAPPSHHPGGGGNDPSEPMRRGAERTTPREISPKPSNWSNQVFLLQVAAIAAFSAVRQRCRNLSDTERGPQGLLRQSITDCIGSLRRLLGCFRQRTIPHRAPLPLGPSGHVTKAADKAMTGEYFNLFQHGFFSRDNSGFFVPTIFPLHIV